MRKGIAWLHLFVHFPMLLLHCRQRVRPVGWTDNELESDCAQLVTALGRILEDRKDYINVVTSLQFVTYILREVNGIVHCLIHIVSTSIIEKVLYEDICNCTRGPSYMSPSTYNYVHH